MVDEFDFVPPAMITKVLLPLLQLDDACLVGTTTPSDTASTAQELLEQKGPDGKRIFQAIQIGMACEACEGTEHAEDCNHERRSVPEWKSASAINRVKALYGTRSADFRREIEGRNAEDPNQAFERSLCKRMMNNLETNHDHPPIQKVFVTFDPNGGSTSDTGSYSAVVSHFFIGGTLYWAGIDHHPTRNHIESQQLVLAHMNALRSIPCLQQAQIVFIPEANLANEGQHVSEEVLKHVPYTTVVCYKSDRYGILTTSESKQHYVFRFTQMLELDAIRWHKDWVSANPLLHEGVSRSDYRKEVRKAFLNELRGFRRVNFLPSRADGDIRVKYSGRSGPNNAYNTRMRDDLVMAALMGNYWSQEYIQKRIHERNTSIAQWTG